MHMREREQRPEYAPLRVDMENRGWDLESCGGEFLAWAKQQSWYRPELLYSGFVADIGNAQRTSSSWGKDIVFCAGEQQFLSGDQAENPMSYAMEDRTGFIGVYDPARMDGYTAPRYNILDPSALLVVVRMTFSS